MKVRGKNGKMRNEGKNKMNKKIKSGFTMLELVVAIFLIAVVIGTALLIMAANLNVIDKSNDIMVANALIQYTVEDIHNIEFPPVYYDRQARFGDRPIDGTTYISPDEVDSAKDGNDWTPDELQDKYIVRRYDFRYDGSGGLFTDATQEDTDRT
ncbi:MAG: prepilin-type N-terminal cleavage/methylation domain-containing protein, partial [Candidatus Ratteibacteria bacterium]|nr:prepilin-type N-terminal cleavage/methylation domain-containing protein [Candidatus Ratteibacteria bacterium]